MKKQLAIVFCAIFALVFFVESANAQAKVLRRKTDNPEWVAEQQSAAKQQAPTRGPNTAQPPNYGGMTTPVNGSNTPSVNRFRNNVLPDEVKSGSINTSMRATDIQVPAVRTQSPANAPTHKSPTAVTAELQMSGFENWEESGDFARYRFRTYPDVSIVTDHAEKRIEVYTNIKQTGTQQGYDPQQAGKNGMLRSGADFGCRVARKAGTLGYEACNQIQAAANQQFDTPYFWYETYMARTEIRTYDNETGIRDMTMAESLEFVVKRTHHTNGLEEVTVVRGDISSVITADPNAPPPKKGFNIANNMRDIFSLVTFMWILDPKNPSNDPNSPSYGANQIPGGTVR